MPLLCREGIRPTSPDPFIDFRNLEFPKPPHPMGGQISLLTPAVYCVFHDTKVMRHLFGGHPRLWFHS